MYPTNTDVKAHHQLLIRDVKRGLISIKEANIALSIKEENNMKKEEIEMKKKELMLHYERMLINDTEGTLGEYSFIDHLIMTIDFLEWEIKNHRYIENHNNWVLASGISKPRGDLK